MFQVHLKMRIYIVILMVIEYFVYIIIILILKKNGTVSNIYFNNVCKLLLSSFYFYIFAYSEKQLLKVKAFLWYDMCLNFCSMNFLKLIEYGSQMIGKYI